MKENNKNKLNLKYNSGITLIALIITIIVLLILAGITINMLLGDNGILARTKDAQLINEIATIQEKIDLAFSEESINRKTGVLVTELKGIDNKPIVIVKILNDDLEYYFIDVGALDIYNKYGLTKISDINVKEDIKDVYMIVDNNKVVYVDESGNIHGTNKLPTGEVSKGIKYNISKNIVSSIDVKLIVELESSADEIKSILYKLEGTEEWITYTEGGVQAWKNGKYIVEVKNKLDEVSIKEIEINELKPEAIISYNPNTNITTDTTIEWNYNSSQAIKGNSIVNAEWENKKDKYNTEGEHIIKLRVQDNSGEWSDWVEENIRVYKAAPTGMQGFAAPMGTVAVPSTTYSNYLPKYALDGVIDNNWWSGSTYTGTLTVNFPYPVPLTKLQISAPQTTGTYNIKVYDGSLLIGQTQIVYPSSTLSWKTSSIFSIIPGSYSTLRFELSNSKSWVAIGEITFFDD